MNPTLMTSDSPAVAGHQLSDSSEVKLWSAYYSAMTSTHTRTHTGSLFKFIKITPGVTAVLERRMNPSSCPLSLSGLVSGVCAALVSVPSSGPSGGWFRLHAGLIMARSHSHRLTVSGFTLCIRR